MTLNGQQLNWLLDGLDISAMKGHKNCTMTVFF